MALAVLVANKNRYNSKENIQRHWGFLRSNGISFITMTMQFCNNVSKFNPAP